jgi:hypothetical protein
MFHLLLKSKPPDFCKNQSSTLHIILSSQFLSKYTSMRLSLLRVCWPCGVTVQSRGKSEVLG